MGSVCCMGVCEVTSCQGHYCVTSSDCSWGETCCSSQCAAESGCVGRSCTHDYDRDVGEKCCLDVCTNAQKCNCDHDSECPIGEICCHGSCSDKGDCSANSYKNPTLVIVGSVLGSLVLISLISIVIYLIYRRRRNIARTGSIQTVPVSVTTPNNTAQNNNNILFKYRIQRVFECAYIARCRKTGLMWYAKHPSERLWCNTQSSNLQYTLTHDPLVLVML